MRIDEFESNILMMFGWVVLSPVMGIVEFAWVPVDAELFLVFSVVEPMKTHIHGFCAFGLDFTVYNNLSHGVVCL